MCHRLRWKLWKYIGSISDSRKPGEIIRDFVAQLRILAEHSPNFGDFKGKAIRNHLVCGMI